MKRITSLSILAVALCVVAIYSCSKTDTVVNWNAVFLTSSGGATNWHISGESCAGSLQTFTDSSVTISAGANSNQIAISNFEGLYADSSLTGKASYTLTLADSLNGTVSQTSDTFVGYIADSTSFDKIRVYIYQGSLNSAKSVFSYSYSYRTPANVTGVACVGTLVKN